MLEALDVLWSCADTHVVFCSSARKPDEQLDTHALSCLSKPAVHDVQMLALSQAVQPFGHGLHAPALM